MSQVNAGFRLAGLAAIFLIVGVLFLAGVEVVCFPKAIEPGSFISRHAASGWVFLIVSISIMILTVDRWMKVLIGTLAVGVLNGILTILTGNLLANPARPVSRLDALCMTVFFAIAAALSYTLRDRKPNIAVRVCVMAFVFSLVWLVAHEGTRDAGRVVPLNRADFAFMGVGLVCLCAAAAVVRVRNHFDGQRAE